jgi:predicted Zn-dependent protease
VKISTGTPRFFAGAAHGGKVRPDQNNRRNNMSKSAIRVIVLFIFCIGAGCNTVNCKNPQDCYQQGVKLLETGKREQAYRFLAKAANDDPSNVMYQWAAARIAPNPKFALFHVKTAWDNGLRNREVFDAYLGLSRITEPTPSLLFALQLYRQLPDSVRTDEVRAGIYFSFKMYDSTIAIAKDIFDKKPAPATGNSLAKAYLAKGDNGKAKEFMLECQRLKLLDVQGYALLNLVYLRDFDYAGCASVFEAAKKDGKYDDELKLMQARGLIAQEKHLEAETLLQQFMTGSNAGKNSELMRNVRIVLAYTAFLKRNTDAIGSLKNILPGDTGSARLEKIFYDAIVKRLSDTSSLVPVLTDLLKKFPAYPEIQIILAQELARSGKNNEAQKVFQNLPDVYLGSPRIIIERARLLDLSGKSSDALAMIGMLHSKKIATKASLELFRDITFKKNMTDEAMQAQKLLEKVYKNDVGVRWAQGVMDLKNGNYDSAITAFSFLSKSYPKEPRFYYGLLTAYFNKGDYDRVIKECSITPSTMSSVLRLQARAYIKREKTPQADSIYTLAMETDKKDIGVKMEYAEFLQHNGNSGKAAQIYRALVDKNMDAIGGDSGKAAAIVLNNLAWSLLQTQGADRELVMSAIKKAYGIDPENRAILDTYAEALLQYGRHAECITLLENNETAKKHGDLLVRLADAFEKSGKTNKAVRTLQEAEKLFDADKAKKDAIHRRIETLIARE